MPVNDPNPWLEITEATKDGRYQYPSGVAICMTLGNFGPPKFCSEAKAIGIRAFEHGGLPLVERMFEGLSCGMTAISLREKLRRRMQTVFSHAPHRPTSQVQQGYGPIVVGPGMPIPQPIANPPVAPTRLPHRKP